MAVFWKLCVALSLSLLVLVSCKDLREEFSSDALTCGYNSCNAVKDDMINIHVVPHTHDDVGWLITVDQYYYERVEYILDSVIPELMKDPTKRFIYVEIAFFARWFREQNVVTQTLVKELVNEGRLEFILGGWCMNDEASTHYSPIIDQHTLGFTFLRENFGHCAKPRVGWQIDPFGHSREQASLFAQFGFDSLFFGRLDYQDKAYRENLTQMEMIWRGSPDNLGTQADLFTGVLQNGYGPPGGYCFDITCGDTPIVDDPRLHDVNVKERVDGFLVQMSSQAKHYSTNHLMVTMGSDFQYQAAHNWYLNLDKLIKYVNAMQANGSKVNLLYSTPSCYTYQVNRANKQWTTKEDDFFPYANDPHSFWTGYFTSRAAVKGYARKSNNFFQAVKQLDALVKLEDAFNSSVKINVLAEAVGVVQHHDAISGTEKQAVAYDYAQRIANGVNEAKKVYSAAIEQLQGHEFGPLAETTFCPLLNISVCPIAETTQEFYLTVYNPVGQQVWTYVRLPVSTDVPVKFVITDPDGQPVPTELIPVTPDTLRIPERKNDTARFEVIFPVSLPPLSYSVYSLGRAYDEQTSDVQTNLFGAKPDVVLENEYLSIAFDGETGAVKNMTNKDHHISINLSQDFAYYKGYAGNNSKDEFQASGAYIFRPNGSVVPVPLSPPSGASLRTKSYYLQGELIQEVYMEFLPWLTQTVKLYEQNHFVEFQWTVGPIDIRDGQGKEVVNRFTTDLNNHQVFYTDANGREILKRTLNHRDTWPLNVTEPVAGNYYPVNSRIFIRDEERQVQFTVLNDRSQGGTSLREGQVELMVHRRLLHDDSRGVGEALNETGSDGKGLIIRGSHYIMLEPISTAAAGHRNLAKQLFMAPQLSFSTSGSPKAIWSGLRNPLPDNVHLLTLERFPGPTLVPSQGESFLLRLEHFYEKGEDSVLSQPAIVNIGELFLQYTVQEAVELTLGADMVLSNLNRLQWNYPHDPTTSQDSELPHKSKKEASSSVGDSLTITLDPMQIRTFQINVTPVTQQKY